MSDRTDVSPFDPTVAPASPGRGEGPVRFVGHAMRLSVLTLVSRLTGLARDMVLAAALGLSGVADAFFIGFLVPNLFRRLFGEGALSAAFIPHYTDLRQRDPATARRFASLCLTLLAVVLAAITLVGEVLLAVLGSGNWSGETALAIRLTMIMLPYMPLVCLVALLGGMLQVHGRFGRTAAAPMVLNLTMIGFTVWAVWGGGSGSFPGPDPQCPSRRVATVVALSVLVAGVGQLLWQLAALRRCTSLTTDFSGTRLALRSMVVMMLPMLVGLAVFQINAFVDFLIAFGFSAKDGGDDHLDLFGYTVWFPIETGGVAALNWSQRLYQFPLGVFGIAIATAIFPALSHAAADGSPVGLDRFASILRHGLRLTMFIGLPAGVGLIILRLPLARVVFQRGAFSPDDAQRVAAILAGYSASLWAYSMAHVVTRAFYARKDVVTPLKVGVAMVVLNLLLNLTLIWPLGAAGLAWATALSAACGVVLLLVALGRHLESPVDGGVWRSWARSAVLTAVMAVVLWPAVWVLGPAAQSAWAAGALLAAAVTVGAVLVFVGAWLSGAQEPGWLWRPGSGP